jgi:hypothetical protein
MSFRTFRQRRSKDNSLLVKVGTRYGSGGLSRNINALPGVCESTAPLRHVRCSLATGKSGDMERQIVMSKAENIRTARKAADRGSRHALESMQYIPRLDRGVVDSPKPSQTSTILNFGLCLARPQCTKVRTQKKPRIQKSEIEPPSNLFSKILNDLHEKLKSSVSQYQRACARQKSKLQ